MRYGIFSTYILTNNNRSILYTGVTNNLPRRLIEHWIGKAGSFTTKYHVYNLVWYEETRYVLNAIAREKEIKDWRRALKEALITGANPDWTFLNATVIGNWPPTEEQVAAVKEYIAAYAYRRKR
jgi:putative endonuclease